MKNKKHYYGFSTKSIHIGEEPDFREGATGDVVKAIHLATTYARNEVDIPTAGYEYSRSQNPTRKALEEKLSALENANFGLAFSSGLAAETAIIHALLRPKDHIIAYDDLYGGTKRLFNNVFKDYFIEVTYTDASVLTNIENNIKENTKIIFLETPTNPLMKLCDIEAISQIAKKHNLILVTDNTFLTPYFQHPLDLGSDIVVHSSTKYLGGHSDVVGGAVMLSNRDMYDKLRFVQNSVGGVPSPFDCYMVMRGIKTLALRMEKHQQNAMQISEYLQQHKLVKKVFYPGLKSHPQHELALKQSRGFGGMISFVIDGDITTAKTFLKNLKLFALAESLGGVESLICMPSLMTHASVSKEELKRVGIEDTLIRVSVGIEDPEDLLADIEQALAS